MKILVLALFIGLVCGLDEVSEELTPHEENDGTTTPKENHDEYSTSSENEFNDNYNNEEWENNYDIPIQGEENHNFTSVENDINDKGDHYNWGNYYNEPTQGAENHNYSYKDIYNNDIYSDNDYSTLMQGEVNHYSSEDDHYYHNYGHNDWDNNEYSDNYYNPSQWENEYYSSEDDYYNDKNSDVDYYKPYQGGNNYYSSEDDFSNNKHSYNDYDNLSRDNGYGYNEGNGDGAEYDYNDKYDNNNVTSDNYNDDHDYYYDYNRARRVIEKPECYFEQLTGACCLHAGMYGQNFRTCIEVALQPSELKAAVVLHVNGKELLSKSVSAGKLCINLPPPSPPIKACLNVYHGQASWHNKFIETCSAIEFGSLVHVRFDCIRFADGKFSHHNDHPPEKYGLLNLNWQNGRPHFSIASQPIPEHTRNWIKTQWSKLKNHFREKSKEFIKWLIRKH